MIVVAAAAPSLVVVLRLVVLLRLHALVVLLNDGCLGVGVGGDRVSDFPQLLLSMSEEAGVGLRARTLLHEVAAELRLELLRVKL